MQAGQGNSGTLPTGMLKVYRTKEETTKGGRCRKNEGVQATRRPKDNKTHNGVRSHSFIHSFIIPLFSHAGVAYGENNGIMNE